MLCMSFCNRIRGGVPSKSTDAPPVFPGRLHLLLVSASATVAAVSHHTTPLGRCCPTADSVAALPRLVIQAACSSEWSLTHATAPGNLPPQTPWSVECWRCWSSNPVKSSCVKWTSAALFYVHGFKLSAGVFVSVFYFVCEVGLQINIQKSHSQSDLYYACVRAHTSSATWKI